jgi:hypothetical protein
LVQSERVREGTRAITTPAKERQRRQRRGEEGDGPREIERREESERKDREGAMPHVRQAEGRGKGEERVHPER